MGKEVSQGTIMQALDWAYDKAINGVAGLDSARELADSYSKEGGSRIDQANSLIRWQNTKAGTSGFLSGLGGIITMPVTIPANIASVMYVQIRMIAAIAHLGGHDLRDDRVKTLVYACLTGNAVKDLLKDVGIVIGRKVSESAIKNISGKTLIEINKKVGFRLFTKFGEKGVVNLGKSVPLFGALVGMTFDAVATNTIGNVARDTFLVDLPAEHQPVAKQKAAVAAKKASAKKVVDGVLAKAAKSPAKKPSKPVAKKTAKKAATKKRARKTSAALMI